MRKSPVSDDPGSQPGPCLNCGDTTPGNYCPVCGQRRADVRVSLRRLAADVLEDQLSISSALPRTIIAVLFRPGRATNEYLRGRIASYIAPFRLYLVASLVFFLLLSMRSRAEGFVNFQVETGADSAAVAAGDTAIAPASPPETDSARERPALQEGARVPDRRGVSIAIDGDSLDANTGIARLDQLLEERARTFRGMEPAAIAAAIVPGVLERLPVAMFLLVPFFAFLLKVLYLRTRRFYVEHFIFALHFHVFAFILFSVMMFIPDAVSGFIGLILLLYLFLAMKRVYVQGVIRTFFKWAVLTGVYLIALGIVMLGAVVVAVLMA
jgi:hypothetical protein